MLTFLHDTNFKSCTQIPQSVISGVVRPNFFYFFLFFTKECQQIELTKYLLLNK